ncbi:TPR end-of-group domain-containing protein [Luteimonas soli]|uniref:TPR end-of-group domain-containing protein n=1 Tax=Luteimonas soli TaxID=1648966 RepID=A0ABV7XQY9_9GAMM
MGGGSESEAGGGFFADLKRRRVIRVLLLYAVAGWIVIEVASVVLPALNLPPWSVTLVIVLVALGFPIAVVMGWMFDLGPGGVARTNAVPVPALAPAPSTEAPAPAEPGTPPGRPAPSEPSAPPESQASDRRTIAVLPFVNMSDDPANEYFSDGISEEILNLLSKLPQLKVASRTSAFNFKGKESSIPAVARELGVGTVLEGSVRRAGNHVRITAQLIDAGSDSHLWSETYDREMKDVFAIQDDIAHSIVKALQVTLTPQERRAMQFVATSDPEAYDYYLRGRNYMYSMARRDYEHAIRMFEQAIAVDSMFALAYAGMADAYSHLYRYVEASPENARKAGRASEQAVALDRDSAEAHASRGMALFIGEDYAAAEAEFESAIALDPNLFEAWYYYGLACSSQGDFAKAASMYIRASEVNPADFQVPLFLAQTYASLGRKQDEMKVRLGALGTVERHLKLNPHDTRALYFGAQNLWRVGEHAKAVELAERALRQDQDEPIVLYNIACFYAEQGNRTRAIELLEKAVQMGWGDRAWMENDSDLDPLHDDPRFKALLASIR